MEQGQDGDVLTAATGTPPPGATVVLAVDGMTCGACAARVQRVLNRLSGVHAAVNYATGRARVDLDPGSPVGISAMLEATRRIGYDARPLEAPTAAPATEQPRPDGAGTGGIRHLGLRLAVALLALAPLTDLTFALALAPALRFAGWQVVLIALTLPVITWCAWPFHRHALRAARHGTTSMDTLISLGVLAAAGWSTYSLLAHADTGPTDHWWGLLLRPSGSIYLDVAAGVTAFVLAGRLFESRASARAGEALTALAALGARDAVLLEAGGAEHPVAVESLRPGDLVVVRPGATVPVDGVVAAGAGSVDTSAMTGESVPAEAAPGEGVLAATVVVGGRIVVRATRVGRDTQLARLRELVDRAQGDKARAQLLADRSAGSSSRRLRVWPW